MKSLHVFVCLQFFCLSAAFSQTADNPSNIPSNLLKLYEQSVDHLNSFENDSAILLLDSILPEIEGTEWEDSPYSLHVQLRKGEALERDNKGDEALLLLQQVKQKAQKKGVLDAYARACINLALQYEKLGIANDCLENLRAAQSTLNKNPELDKIYPFFCVRMSSYHRFFGDRDSSIYYAQECLRTYKKYNDLAQGADGYMLMTLIGSDDVDERIEYAKSSIEIFKELDNYTGLAYMLTNVTRLLYSKQDYEQALLYNDSTIHASKRSVQSGYEVYHALYSAYKFRGEIYSSLNQHDSASIYLRKGYELQNARIQEENTAKILEIDTKYKDDQKARKIEEQSHQLRSQKLLRTMLLIIFGLVTLFAAGLSYYYTKLRKAKTQTELQAKQIKQTNIELTKALNKQIILQGEVHHRVKNNLEVIISLLERQKEDLSDKEAIAKIDSMSKRIYSMAAIHNLLYKKEDMEFIKLQDYINDLCYHFSNFSIQEDKPIFNLNIVDVDLNLETAMPIGIIITELLTNSLKYARKSNVNLEISIIIQNDKDQLDIHYSDNGPGFKEDFLTQNGLGFYILDSMTRQLQGEMKYYNGDGAHYEITVKKKNINL